MAVVVGSSLRHQTPKATRWLLACWTPGLLVAAGAIAAFLAELSAPYIADSDASEATRITAAFAAATLAAVATHVNSWLPDAARSSEADVWHGSNLEKLLRIIKDADDAEQTAKHSGWRRA